MNSSVRSRLASICLFVLIIGCATSAAVAEPEPPVNQLLVGAGVPASDWKRLQTAVDRGGAIELRGRFALSDQQSVVITRGVTLYATPCPDGTPGATIAGGQPPIYFEADARLVVRGIRFEDAIGRAIDVRQATGVLIEKCEVLNVRPALDWWGLPVLSSVGIEIESWKEGQGIDFSKLTGDVIVRDNLIEPNPDPGHTPAYDTDLGLGIDYYGGRARLEVSGNTFRNISTAGIHLFEFEGRTSVTSNIVEMGPLQLPDAWMGYGNGIGTGAISGLSFDLGSLLVAGNEVFTPNPGADGIIVFDYRPQPHDSPQIVVAGNRVVMNSECCGALTVYYGVQGASFAANRVEGSMVWAGGIAPYIDEAGLTATGNMFAANDLSGATALHDAFFMSGADHNTFVGTCRSSWDEGVDNLIIDRATGSAAIQRAEAALTQNPPVTQVLRDKMRMLVRRIAR